MSQMEIQAKLAQAFKLLKEAGDMAEEESIELDFFGCVFEPKFGWFSTDGKLQQGSEWNFSDCVIGSEYHEAYGMEGWKGHKFQHYSYPEDYTPLYQEPRTPENK